MMAIQKASEFFANNSWAWKNIEAAMMEEIGDSDEWMAALEENEDAEEFDDLPEEVQIDLQDNVFGFTYGEMHVETRWPTNKLGRAVNDVMMGILNKHIALTEKEDKSIVSALEQNDDKTIKRELSKYKFTAGRLVKIWYDVMNYISKELFDEDAGFVFVHGANFKGQ